MIEHKPSERGQIVIFLALFFLVLLVIAAIAIDAGTVYSNRRYTQNVADSASQAGASKISFYLNQRNPNDSAIPSYVNFSCSDDLVIIAMDQAVNEAILRASANNFILDEDISDGQGVQVVCNDVGNGSGYRDKYIEVVVKMVSETETAFAHLLFGGSIIYTVESVSRVYPGAIMGIENSILSFTSKDENCPIDLNLSFYADPSFKFICESSTQKVSHLG